MTENGVSEQGKKGNVAGHDIRQQWWMKALQAFTPLHHIYPNYIRKK
jgi:hypothetical protein